MFIELYVRFRMPSGLYFITGTIIPVSFEGVPADARISTGAGFTLRYKYKAIKEEPLQSVE